MEGLGEGGEGGGALLTGGVLFRPMAMREGASSQELDELRGRAAAER